MKSRTLSSEGTFLKKNITRFMPFWVLYTVCLLLGLMMISGSDREVRVAINMGETARAMAFVNCCYALLVVQLLFGDLYDARMCSGIHSLPLRREEIFGLNILSGLLFSLVPTLIMALCSLPVMNTAQVEGAWKLSVIFWVSSNLQFVFFFGVAVLCAFLAGNRFSLCILYGMVNFWSILLMLVVQSLYLPMLPGVSLDNRWAFVLCPMQHILEDPLVIVSRMDPLRPGTIEIQGAAWGYLGICALIGLGLMALALLLYRKRKLENAGDFIAIKCLKPVFLVIFAVMAACGFAVVSGIVFGFVSLGRGMAFSVAGLAIGWFIGAMLLEKTTRVFCKKNWIRGGILMAVLLASFLTTRLDPLGIRTRIPDPEDIAWARITDAYNYYGPDYDYYSDPKGEPYRDRLMDRGDIDLVTRLHRLALEQNITQKEVDRLHQAASDLVEQGKPYELERDFLTISIEYTLKNGSVVRRYYYIWADGETAEIASWLFSQPEVVFGGQADIVLTDTHLIYVNANNAQLPESRITDANMDLLKQAILQDCEEGHMANAWALHKKPIFEYEDAGLYAIQMSLVTGDNRHTWFQVYGEAEHTLQWLEDNGMLEKVIGEYIEEYEEYSR